MKFPKPERGPRPRRRPAPNLGGRRPRTLPPAVKKTLRAVFAPPGPVVVLAVVLGVALLVWAFTMGEPRNPLVYVAYTVSAYALVVACVYVATRRPVERALAFIRGLPLVGALVDDRTLRIAYGVQGAFLIDVFWAVANFVLGVWNGSLWFVTLGVYYLLLTLMRLVLARHARRGDFGGDLRGEYRTCLACGVLISVTIVALSGVVLLVINRAGGFSYFEYVLYAVAFYTFYTLINSIVNFVKFRRNESPVLAAIMCTNLVVALVSMFTLEVAMLTAFSGAGQEGFELAMLAATGGVVALIVLGLGLSVAIGAGRALGRLDREPFGEKRAGMDGR